MLSVVRCMSLRMWKVIYHKFIIFVSFFVSVIHLCLVSIAPGHFWELWHVTPPASIIPSFCYSYILPQWIIVSVCCDFLHKQWIITFPSAWWRFFIPVPKFLNDCYLSAKWTWCDILSTLILCACSSGCSSWFVRISSGIDTYRIEISKPGAKEGK